MPAVPPPGPEKPLPLLLVPLEAVPPVNLMTPRPLQVLGEDGEDEQDPADHSQPGVDHQQAGQTTLFHRLQDETVHGGCLKVST